MTTSLPASLATQRRRLMDNQPARVRADTPEGWRADRIWQRQLDILEQQMMDEWSSRYRVVPAGGECSWQRLHGKRAPYRPYWYSAEEDAGQPWHHLIANAYPGFIPYSDHTSHWRKAKVERGRNYFLEVIVTQPYQSISNEEAIGVMKAFADAKRLAFWISTAPGWHNPGHCLFIEWTSPDSDFNRLRLEAAEKGLVETLMVHQPNGHQKIS